VNTIGLAMVGPAVMHHGTQEQKTRWLRPILAADEIWCQGFSEDYCILLVRTAPDAPKHKGISCLLVDMHSPGVTIRPLVQVTGDAEFNEVFFDEVRVPRSSLLGRVHGGWEVAITILMYERMSLGGVVGLHQYVDRVLALARQHAGASGDPVVRQRLADLYISGRALRLTNLRYMTRELRGEAPGAEGSVLKLTFTDAYKQMADIATQIIGLYHQIWGDDPLAPEGGRWAFQALFANRFGIAGGTDQIQRSIIGERLLGLPR
jgi:alkylation response protein AidB-like acyl-CoA dehydrogenase